VIGKAGDYVLGDDGKWTGPVPGMVEILNDSFAPRDRRFEPSLAYGVEAVVEAAKKMGVKAEIDPEANPDLPEGAVS
jgi:hypothetical protein